MRGRRLFSIQQLGTSGLRVIRKGRGVRLVAPEGTFSYFHPDHTFSGFAWDAQTASLVLRARPARSVLILGLGGGTVARQCRTILPKVRLVGVEVDKEVLRVALDDFHLQEWKVRTHCLPAETFLARSSDRFDAILDDIWLSQPVAPKPLFATDGWLPMVRSRLKRNGIYAVTIYGRTHERSAFDCALRKLKAHFGSVCEVRPARGQTTVLAAADRFPTAAARLRRLVVPWSTGREGMMLWHRRW